MVSPLLLAHASVVRLVLAQHSSAINMPVVRVEFPTIALALSAMLSMAVGQLTLVVASLHLLEVASLVVLAVLPLVSLPTQPVDTLSPLLFAYEVEESTNPTLTAQLLGALMRTTTAPTRRPTVLVVLRIVATPVSRLSLVVSCKVVTLPLVPAPTTISVLLTPVWVGAATVAAASRTPLDHSVSSLGEFGQLVLTVLSLVPQLHLLLV